MMSETTTDDMTRAEQYATLAERVADADDATIWRAFAEKMDELATETDHAGGRFAGYVLATSPERVDTGVELKQLIAVTYRQFGDSRDELLSGALARSVDVYAVRRQSAGNAVNAGRHAVVDALERAAEDA